MASEIIQDLQKKYLLTAIGDDILLKVERAFDLLYPLKLETLYLDLQRRNIKFNKEQVAAYFEEANGNFEKIAQREENTVISTVFQIKVTKDKMKAYLLVNPVINGSLGGRDEIEETLRQNNINKGIKNELFSTIIAKQDDYYEWLIAEGVDKTNGENAQLKYCFDTQEVGIKPVELEDGSVDFYNLGLIQVVESGSVLVEKIPPTSGTDGYNVHGETIKASPGKDVRLPAGKNTKASDDDMKLLATNSGHICMNGKKVSIHKSYEVKSDVDFNVGNINFPGNVIIQGSVKNGFLVNAEGDVEINGTLAGTVTAGGNIVVKKGIVRGKAFAEGSVYTRNIENSTVESKSSIMAKEAIMHSNIKAVKSVKIDGKRGLLVGGSCCAGEEIQAKNIGSGLGTNTLLEVGMRPEIREEYKELVVKLKEMEAECEKNEKIIRSINEFKKKDGQLDPRKNQLFIKLCGQYANQKKEIEIMKNRQEELELIFKEMKVARICVEKTIYPGVQIHMGKASLFLKEENSNVIYVLDRMDIKHMPLR